VVSFSPAQIHPAWCFLVRGSELDPLLGWEATHGRSQDLEPFWALNGALYIIAPERLRWDGAFVTVDTCPLLIESPDEAIDIDTPADWALAESVLARQVTS
jgi:CMP-N,N'-diacetyllegionaminic acid synthase